MYRLPLFAIRTLDLADGVGAYTGRILGDMGAEVIKVELPSGDTLRGSEAFQRLNANKYGCTLDLTSSAGRQAIAALAEQSDALIAPSSFDTTAIAAANPALVIVVAATDVTSAVAAAGATGLALWHRRRTNIGGQVTTKPPASRPITGTGTAPTEPVSTLSEGVLQLEAVPWRLSESPAHIRLPAPALGEHNTYVFEHLLGESS